MAHFSLQIALLILLFVPFKLLALLPLAPWEIQITSIQDSIYTTTHWEESDQFQSLENVTIPQSLGNGTYLMVLRSRFQYDSSSNDLTVSISPTDHPYRIYINGTKVLHYGITQNPSVASNYKSEMAYIPPGIVKAGENKVVMVLYPRGENSAAPEIFIDSYLPNLKRNFWQTFLNYTFIAGLCVNGALIFLLFISFWISSQRERKDYLFFALTSMFISLGYLNVIFATPIHIEPPLWIIARSSFVAASATLMTFTSIHSGLEPKLKWVNRLFLFSALIFFFHVVMMDNKFDIDKSFTAATSFIITPALVLSLGMTIHKFIRSKQWTDLLIVIGISSTFVTAFHDMYYFRNFKIPYFWTVAYGYAVMEIAIVVALSKDLWKLFIENRHKAELLIEKNSELELQKFQLEEVSNGKSRFLRNMAHEFKTPLQGIVTIAELLQKRGESRETVKTILEALNIQMQKHLYNIQNVIDLSILEEKIPDIHKKTFSKAQFIQVLELMFQNNEHNRSNRLNLSIDSSLPDMFFGDNEHISRITINLLTNMVSELVQTEIACSLNWSLDSKILEIRMNNGTGKIHQRAIDILRLPQEEILIQYNDDNGIDDLAVFVAARLIPALEGECIIREDDGEIVLRFPLEEVSVSHEKQSGNGKILVAEDNPVNRMLICKILEKLGYTVVTAEDGKEAVERTLADNPSLIFMDVQMPEMSGIEATREIRNHHSDTIIIALTANANKSECLDAGMNDFLNKPARMEELKNLIDHYLAS